MSKLSQSLLLRPHKQQRRGSGTSNMKSCYASSEAASDDQSYQVPAPQQNEFAADEPLPSTSPTQATTGSHKVTIKTHTETTAIPAADSRPQYPALVSICAPPLEDPDGEGRTPIDLVTVLDVSGSMQGQKLELVKQAVKFVIENLGSSDRLSIVSFSSTARTEFPLRRMSADGREDAIRAVNSLRTEGMTNIAAGLKIGAQILKGRREKNPVASIILLSDGHDNCSSEAEMLNNLPSSIPSSNNIKEEIPVHTFGFGNDHDPKTMHAISDASGGTFSYIESVGMIQDGFALCIGGLLSVVAQEVRLTVKSASSGVKIVSIPSGRHVNEVSDEGQQGVVHVGNMYAEEVKLFLVYLSVPPSSASDSKTPLLDVSCAYKDPASDELIQVQGERVEISRPQFCSPAEVAVSLEVDRQRNRLLVADAIGEAQRLAEMGNLEGARKVLTHRRKTLLASAAALGGDSLSKLLETELREVRDRMESREMYEYVGRAYACAGMSSHSLQRASARGNARGSCLAAGLKLAAKTGCFVYSRGRSAGAHGGGVRGGGGRGGGGRGSRGGLGSRGSFGASGRGFRGRGAAGRGASRSMLFNDASLHGDEDEAEDCEADHLVGAFETPAMIRMVQKSQKRNRST